MNTLALANADLPAVFRHADQIAVRGQRTCRRATGIQLIALIVAAVFGGADLAPASQVHLTSYLAVAALCAALAATAWLAFATSSRSWYHGRTAAEAVKSLSWRFAMEAEPFRDGSDLDLTFARHIEAALRHLRSTDTSWTATASREDSIISEAMRSLRAAPFLTKQQVYNTSRLEDQYQWYVGRSVQHASAARRWTLAFVLAAGAGVVCGVLRGMGIIDFDALGMATAVAASAMAWVQYNQSRQLANAYAATAHDLLLAKTRLNVSDEEQWHRHVSAAEDIISREHASWLTRKHSL